MSSKLIIHYGPCSQRRNRSALQEHLETAGPPEATFLWVVTTAARQKQLTDLVLHQCPGIFESPVITLSRLLGKLLSKYSPDRVLIGETERRALISKILASGELADLSGVTPESHLRRHLSQYIAFIKSLSIEDEAMLRLRYSRFRRNTRPLEESLIRLFATYQQRLASRGLEDWEGALNYLYSGLLTGRMTFLAVFPDKTSLFFEDLSPRTAVERGLLRLVCKEVSSVQISIQTPEGAEPDSLANQLDFLAPQTEIQWTYHPPPSSPAKRLLIRAVNREVEILSVVGQILDFKDRDPQLRFSDIAVVCAQPDLYSTHVSEVFQDSGIPFYFPGGLNSARAVSSAILLKYLDILEQNQQVTTVLDLLELVDPSGENFPGERLLDIEKAVREGGLERGYDAWAGKLSDLMSVSSAQSGCYPKDHLPNTEESLQEWIRAIQIDIASRRTLIQWCVLFFERAMPMLKPGTGQPVEPGCSEQRFVSGLLANLRKEILIWQGDTCAFDEFASILRDNILRTRIDSIPSEDAVAVGSPEELHQCEFSFMFWVGLVDGEFPVRTSQHLFFEDVHSLHWGLPSWHERFEAARGLFDRVSSGATSLMTFSFPRRIGDLTTIESPFLQGAGITEYREAQLVSSLRSKTTPDTATNIQRGQLTQAVRETNPHSEFDGFIRTPAVREQFREAFFGQSVVISPNRLEEYHRCGFRYFLSRIVDIEPFTDKEDRVAKNLGNLIHETLRRFVSDEDLNSKRQFAVSREAWLSKEKERMAAILSEEVASLFDLTIERLDLFWRDRIDKIAGGLTQEGADGLLAEFLAQTWDSLKEFEIEASERTMGPVRLGFLRTGGRSEKEKRVPVYLRGKIDRIDKASGMTRIIDYKTGPQPTSGALHGWGFQLPLYALLLMKDEPTREVEACFYSIRLPLEVKQVFLAARIENGTRTVAPFVRYYRRKALRTVSCLYQGRFPFTVLPRSRAGCSSCPFRQICRYDPVKSASILDRKLFPGQELLVEHGKWIGPTDQRNSPGPNPSSPTGRCSEN